MVFGLIALLIYGVTAGGSDDSLDHAVERGERPVAPVRAGRVVGDDESTSIGKYRGKVVALNFWASWCKPCEKEAPDLERAYQRYGDAGFVVLGADMDDLTGKALEFRRRFGVTYPMFRYSSDDAARDYGTRQLPETFLIDRRGRVVDLIRGQVDYEWLSKRVPPLLKETGGGESDAAP